MLIINENSAARFLMFYVIFIFSILCIYLFYITNMSLEKSCIDIFLAIFVCEKITGKPIKWIIYSHASGSFCLEVIAKSWFSRI